MRSTEAVPAITADSTVGETMRAFPATTAVFLRRRMHCPGCHMAAFMTLREAAATYDIAAEDLLADLRAAMR
jgi:hybrid cluster-associated redox disulfide protein